MASTRVGRERGQDLDGFGDVPVRGRDPDVEPGRTSRVTPPTGRVIIFDDHHQMFVLRDQAQ
jgi:hypothetical protein